MLTPNTNENHMAKVHCTRITFIITTTEATDDLGHLSSFKYFLYSGTHFMWETMMMLLKGSADYIRTSKGFLMIDASPISFSSKPFPSPRAMNTHYRTDVLPAEFRKAKTVVGKLIINKQSVV